ncbi:2OG-Fe(II) oxygenase [Thalassobius vesicularis]|uniref:2OG-Fe(II) oxygenase n=1 Tax=Thalassobius vesicularis TaxID=1294297 RepID=A0A4S3MBC1_9RHOB|nr:2OG-Fe(II) oxygenase [Thalassobius vesicularis]THD75933.1 2OG-Fe(II) oxygenase [Thalassobius vesicularis]
MLSVHSIPNAFSIDQCNEILTIVAAQPSQDAGLVKQNSDHNIRRADLVWLDDVAGTDWVMDRIIDLVREANRDVYDFDLREFAESPQVARYGAEREGHFDWHSDIGEGVLASKRKLTMVIQLTPGSEYEGGGLEVMPSNHVISADRAQGCATLFPSMLLHRVVPVTAGGRHSLTIWAHGPAFR